MDGVPRPLADFGPDVLADADDVAGRLHPHKLPVVALSVKGGVDQHPPLTKGGFDIKWNFNVGRVHIRIFVDNGVEFVQHFAIFSLVGIFFVPPLFCHSRPDLFEKQVRIEKLASR